jgi:predicted RNase H-like nuclease (RuvC/YqgF family)
LKVVTEKQLSLSMLAVEFESELAKLEQCIKDLQERNQDLEQRNQDLERRNQALDQEIKRLTAICDQTCHKDRKLLKM